jgi:hypothetical protein
MRKKQSPNKLRGQALIMVTLSLVPMFGLLGLAVDLGWMEFTKKSAQSAPWRPYCSSNPRRSALPLRAG